MMQRVKIAMPVEGFTLSEEHFDPRHEGWPIPPAEAERDFAARVVYVWAPGRVRVAHIGDFIFLRPDGMWDVIPAKEIHDKIITT
ncbi:MAG: hypothetical protein D6751_05495 [Deltaproteobacteria bacterium]|nr:MAG: hypothetical protein D6751_05495 [Deltaproteobacteria bacterium]